MPVGGGKKALNMNGQSVQLHTRFDHLLGGGDSDQKVINLVLRSEFAVTQKTCSCRPRKSYTFGYPHIAGLKRSWMSHTLSRDSVKVYLRANEGPYIQQRRIRCALSGKLLS